MNTKSFVYGTAVGALATIAFLYLFNQAETLEGEDESEDQTLSVVDTDGNPIDLRDAIGRSLEGALTILGDVHKRISAATNDNEDILTQADAFAHHLLHGVTSGAILVDIPLPKNKTVYISAITVYHEIVRIGSTMLRPGAISKEAMGEFVRFSAEACNAAKTTGAVAKILSNSFGEGPTPAL